MDARADRKLDAASEAYGADPGRPARRFATLAVRWRRLAREPLLHFFLVGAVLFALAERHRAQTDVYRIVVTPERVREIAMRYQAEFGNAPAPATLAQLVDSDIDEEVLYREGLARKLDRDDEIIRRRIVQKVEFLQQDLAAPAAPTEMQLRAWYAAHASRYAAPATVSFSHIYFVDGAAGEQAARARASLVLKGLPDAIIRAPERGDPFPDLYDYAGFGQEQARRLFGDSALSRGLFRAPTGRWTGPLRSNYGWHLVRVQTREPARMPPFAEVRDRVQADVIAADQEAANRRSFAKLKARFKIIRQDGL